MSEDIVQVRTADGTMKTFVTHPERDEPLPAVVLYMDFWGVREELCDIARRIAAAGYYCLVPDLYYRQGTIRNEFHDERGKMISLNRLDEARQATVLAPLRKFSDAEAMRDTAAMLQFLDRTPPVSAGAKGCVGFCLGGRLALRAGSRFPEQFRACASLHGSALVTDREDSPHHTAHKLKGELYCGFAELDPYTSPSTVAALQSAMQSSAATYRWVVHAGAEHGYALPDRDVHDETASRRDWEGILAMFRRQLCPYPT